MSSVPAYKLYLILIASIVMALVFPFWQIPGTLSILFVLIVYIILLSFINEKLGLFLLLIARPTLDILTGEKIFDLLGYPINLSYLIGAFTLIFAITVLIKNFKRLWNAPALFPWLGFLLLVLISLFLSINPRASLAEFIRLSSIVAIYLVAYTIIRSKDDFLNLIRAAIFSSFIPLMFAFYQYLNKTGMSVPLEGIYNRIFGTFAHPNLFAYYLIIPIAFTTAFLLIKRSRDVFFVAWLPFLCLALALTFTRGAWVALVVTLFFVGVARFKKLLVVSFLILLLLYGAIGPIRNRVNDLLSYKNPYSSIQWRITLWKDSVTYIEENPLIGFGAGTAEDVILKKRGEQFGSASPHNDYLKIALENGYLGLIAYVLMILALITNLFQRFFYNRDFEIRTYAIFLIGLTLAFYGLSFADNVIRNTALQWTYWALLGGFFSVSKVD